MSVEEPHRRAHPERIVVVGGGVGGYSAVAALRRHGFSGSLVLVSDEKHPPYDRPPLSKAVLKAPVTEGAELFQELGWYAENGIDLVLNDAARAVDRAGRTVTLVSGRVLPYDRLLLATGSRARRLAALEDAGVDVHYLRSFADSDRLRARLADAPRVVVVGAGVIGMEVAATARQLGCEVTVVEAAGRVMSRSVSATVSTFLAHHHAVQGVRILLGTTVAAAQPFDGGTRLTLSDGTTLQADVVVAGVGAEPAAELAAEAGIEVDDGVLVDARTCTSDPYVHAIGDVARFQSVRDQRPTRIEHWRHAVDHAATAAAAMLGEDVAYEEQPWMWTDQFDLNVQVVGRPVGDSEVLRGAPSAAGFVAFQLAADGGLVGAILVNQGRHRRPLAKIVARRPTVPLEALGNLSTPIAALA